MRRIVLIALDIRVPSPAADKILFDAVKAQGTWWHYLRSTWLVHTDKSPQEVADALHPHLKGRGRMLVVELRQPYQGLLPKTAWEWINKRVESEDTV